MLVSTQGDSWREALLTTTTTSQGFPTTWVQEAVDLAAMEAADWVATEVHNVIHVSAALVAICAFSVANPRLCVVLASGGLINLQIGKLLSLSGTAAITANGGGGQDSPGQDQAGE